MTFLRHALFAGLPFAVGMTIVFSLRSGPAAGLVTGSIAGALFGVLLAAFTGWQRKRMHVAGGLLDGERILHQGPANHRRGPEARGGWLVLTERALVFRSHGLNVQNAPLRVLLSEVRGVRARRTLGLIPNGLLVERVDGREDLFAVGGREEWTRAIEAARVPPVAARDES